MQEFKELKQCQPFLNWYENKRLKFSTNEELLEKTRNAIRIMNQTGKIIPQTDKEHGIYVTTIKKMYVDTKEGKGKKGFTKKRIQEFRELEQCQPFLKWYENERREILTNEELLEKTRTVIKIMNKGEKIIFHTDKEHGKYVSWLKHMYVNTKKCKGKGGFTEERMQEFRELEQCQPFLNWYENERREISTNEELLEKTRNVIIIMNQTCKIIPKTDKEHGRYVFDLKQRYANTKLNRKGNKRKKFTEERMREFRELEQCQPFLSWYETIKRK